MTDCQSGRTAFFGGAWTVPCASAGIHHIGSPEAEPIILCDEHFQEVLAAGLVTEPNLEKNDYERRETQRALGKGRRGWFRR